LTAVKIPSSVTSIGDWAFSSCGGLTSVMTDARNTVYRGEGNCVIRKSDNMLVLGCKNSVIPLSVTGIGDYAFCGCGGLTSIKIPPSVRSIGSYSFSGCGELKSIGIPSLVTNIGAYAFSNCNKLKTV
jgi:hypothetical protein